MAVPATTGAATITGCGSVGAVDVVVVVVVVATVIPIGSGASFCAMLLKNSTWACSATSSASNLLYSMFDYKGRTTNNI